MKKNILKYLGLRWVLFQTTGFCESYEFKISKNVQFVYFFRKIKMFVFKRTIWKALLQASGWSSHYFPKQL